MQPEQDPYIIDGEALWSQIRRKVVLDAGLLTTDQMSHGD
jgi:hypothetical protein